MTTSDIAIPADEPLRNDVELLPHHAEQFEDMAQQRESATLGMWVFLANEILFFGTIFVGFYVMRSRFERDFAEGARELVWWIGCLNTAVLLLSSYFMASAVHAANTGETRAVTRRLIYTIILALVFFGLKMSEYGIDWHDKLVPLLNYSTVSPEGTPRGQHVPMLLCFYYFATLLHALHVLIGVVLLSIIAWMNHRGRFNQHYYTPVEVAGLYWHFVDLVWIFLFPTLYLLRH